MIVTNMGKAGVNSSNQITIDKVIFSDFRLYNISDYEQRQITAIQGVNTIDASPTVALLSNGHALVQSNIDANFSVNSVFILASGNDNEFVLAVTDSSGSLSEEINIDAIRRLQFNATANNLVMKSDVSSLVASNVASLLNDVPSYASDAYSRANDYTNSYVDNKLNSNLNLDSTYANQAYSSATSYADSRLATKADATELSNYATQSELSNYATNSTLADYATNISINSLSSEVDAASNNAKSSNDSNSQVNSIYFAQNDYDKAILTNKITNASKTAETIFNQLAADNATNQSNIAANYASLKNYIDEKLAGK